MEAVSIQCNKCGAPLTVGERTHFATCGYCGSSLEIKRDGGVIYTEVLDTIAANTAGTVQILQSIKAQGDIAMLDNTWRDARGGWARVLADKQAELDSVAALINAENRRPIQKMRVLKLWSWRARYSKLKKEYADLLVAYQEAERRYLQDRGALAKR